MGPHDKAKDPLFTTVKEIIAYAGEHAYIIFYGLAHGGEDNTVQWNEEHGGGWQKFLEWGKSVGVKVIYLNWTPFEQFQVDDALQRGEPSDDETWAPEESELESYIQQVEKYREKVGQTAVVDLACVLQGVFHIHQITADWFEAFQELTAEDEEEETTEEVDKALVNEWAIKLATHPSYRNCKTNDQREYLLEKVAGETYERLPVWQILARAETIYQLDVRPKAEEQLREEARTLRNQGLNLNAIAQKLCISRDRVSGLLAG